MVAGTREDRDLGLRIGSGIRGSSTALSEPATLIGADAIGAPSSSSASLGAPAHGGTGVIGPITGRCE